MEQNYNKINWSRSDSVSAHIEYLEIRSNKYDWDIPIFDWTLWLSNVKF